MPTPTAPPTPFVHLGYGASWADHRKSWSSMQAVQPQAAEEPQTSRCILVDDPEKGTVFGSGMGPTLGSVAHVELTTSQVTKEVKKLVKLAKEQLQKLSYSEGRLMMHKPSMSDFLKQLRQNIAAGACFTFLFWESAAISCFWAILSCVPCVFLFTASCFAALRSCRLASARKKSSGARKMNMKRSELPKLTS